MDLLIYGFSVRIDDMVAENGCWLPSGSPKFGLIIYVGWLFDVRLVKQIPKEVLWLRSSKL